MWWVFFFFCFPRRSYFKSVLPLFPPPGLFCLVLGHLRSGHPHSEVLSPVWGEAAGCLGGQSPGAVLAVGGSPRNEDQSLDRCLYPETQDHAAGLAGCYFRTPGTFSILCHNLEQQKLTQVESLTESLAPCGTRVTKRGRAPVQYFSSRPQSL